MDQPQPDAQTLLNVIGRLFGLFKTEETQFVRCDADGVFQFEGGSLDDPVGFLGTTEDMGEEERGFLLLRCLSSRAYASGESVTRSHQEDVHLCVLRILEQRPDISQRELAEELGIAPGKAQQRGRHLGRKGTLVDPEVPQF